MSSDDKHTIDCNATSFTAGDCDAEFQLAADNSGWDGIVVRWGYNSSTDDIYIRFEDGSDPDDKDCGFSPNDEACFYLYQTSNVKIHGFTLKNSYYGVRIYLNSDSNEIYDNTIISFKEAIQVYGYLTNVPDSNLVHDNNINMTHIYSDFGYNWYRNAVDNQIWHTVKDGESSYDRVDIHFYETGNGNKAYNNICSRGFDGIIIGDASTNRSINTEVYNNTITYHADSGMEISTQDGEGVKIYDNTIHEATSPIRIKNLETGPVYMYRNKITLETIEGYSTSDPAGSLVLSLTANEDTTGILYFYHNSLATIGSAVYLYGDSASTNKLPNFWFVNNVFGCESLLTTDANFGEPLSHTCFNYAGGTELEGNDYWPLRHDNTGDLQNVEGTVTDLWTSFASVNVETPITPSVVTEKGADVSDTFLCDGDSKSALPGFSGGYFDGTAPDIGAVQWQILGSISYGSGTISAGSGTISASE